MRGTTPLLAVAVLVGWMAIALARPPVTVACSCAMAEHPMRDAAAVPELSVFAGVAGPLQPEGVRVRLTRWFRGLPPPSGVLFLDPAGFVDPNGGSCGTNPPGAGEEWIFVLGRNQVGRYDMSLCSTAAPIAADHGGELLAEAVAVFGPGTAPAATAPPGEAPSGTDEPWSTLASIAVPAAVLAAAVGFVAGMFAVLGRRREGPRPG